MLTGRLASSLRSVEWARRCSLEAFTRKALPRRSGPSRPSAHAELGKIKNLGGSMSQLPIDTEAKLDLSDVEPRVGQLVGGGQRRDPCSANEIRRWVMAMDYPNPIHWDADFAAQSKLGGI